MKHIFLPLALVFFISCGQADKKTEEDIPPANPADTNSKVTMKKALEYPALYTEWEIGDTENINTVLTMYKDWDENAVIQDYELFADTVIIDMPDGNRALAPRSEMVTKLNKFRNHYKHTENRVISIYPLHNTQTDAQWVSVMVYNKWTYNDNKKDSLLYNDRWRLNNGKINYLLSLQQTPSRMEVKMLENMTREWKP